MIIWTAEDYSSGRVFWQVLLCQGLFALFELGLGVFRGFSSFNRREMLNSFLIYLLYLAFTSYGMGEIYRKVLSYSYERRLLDPGLSPWLMLLYAFVVMDFFQYLCHVFNHHVRWGWAMHMVHHMPENINFTVGPRLGIPGILSIFRLAFPIICWLGVPPLLLMNCFTLSFLYQTFTHTELIPRMRWVEYVFVTPYFHRIHHGSNPECRNRNFGAVFTIFDRIFGTLAEGKPVSLRYGIGRPIPTNFLGQDLMGWKELVLDLWAGKMPFGLVPDARYQAPAGDKH